MTDYFYYTISLLLRIETAKHGLHHYTRNLIRVGVTGGPPVLKVSESLATTFPGNPDRRTTVRNTVRKCINAASLMTARQAQRVVLAVDGDVLTMAKLKLLDRSLDELHATGLAHIGGREVGVKTGTVPVTGNGLRVERNLGTKLLRNAVKEETSDPEVVTHCVFVSTGYDAMRYM